VSGRVGAGVEVTRGRVEVTGRVGGAIRVGLGSVTLLPGARVLGPVDVARGWVSRSPGAVAQGGVHVARRLSRAQLDAALGSGLHVVSLAQTLGGLAHLTFVLSPVAGSAPAFGFMAFSLTWLGILLRIAWMLAGWVLGVILLALFPGAMAGIDETIGGETGRSLLTGILAAILFVPAAVALAVTLVGVLLIPFLALFYLAAGVIGGVAGTRWVGRSLWTSLDRGRGLHPALELGLGTISLLVVGFIPFLGALATLLVPLTGLGAVLLSRFGTHRPWWRRRQPA
jgi:hypothetical protein